MSDLQPGDKVRLRTPLPIPDFRMPDESLQGEVVAINGDMVEVDWRVKDDPASPQRYLRAVPRANVEKVDAAQP
jgi:hypothetical protein